MELKHLPHFFNNKIYTVPDYQRGFSWEPRHVTDLLTDISNSIKLDKPHYMGTISLHPQHNKVKVGVNNFTNYHVVDGQQRLTTLIMILSYILRILSEREETKEDADEKIKSYLKSKGTYVFRYEIDKVSDDFFRSSILELENKTSLHENLYTRNLLKAKKTIADYFKNDNENEMLLSYLAAIEEKLSFNEFVLEDGTEIGVVFETMNNRGIGLSDLEIVKNRLLYLTSKVPTSDETESELLELSSLINKKWSHILQNLTLPNKVLSEDAFLSNHWIIYKGWTKDNTAKSEILQKKFTINQMLKHPEKMAEEIKRYITSLAETSLIWRHINYPEEKGAFQQIKDSNIRQSLIDTLAKLNRISNSTIRPVILAFYPLLDTKPEFVLELSKLAEIFSFRLFSMNKKRSDTGKNDFYRQCHEFHKNSDDVKIQKKALFYIAWYIETHGDWKRFELEKEELFSSHKKNGFYSWSGLAYFLYEYEEMLRNNQSIKVDYSFASQTYKSVEHVLPQTLTNYWKEILSEVPKAERKELIHSLGNLILISVDKNSELRNNVYEIKRDSYKIGSFSENKLAKDFTAWGKNEIEKRERQLTRFLKNRWRIDDDFLEIYPSPDGESDLSDKEFEEESE